MTIIPILCQYLLLFMFFLENGVEGFVDMSCSPTDTVLGQASTCTCTTDSGTGIAWQKDGTDIMLCFIGGNCDNTPPAYDNGYSTLGANKVFTITIKAFGYTDCSVFTCKDQDTTDKSSETLAVYDFDNSTIVPSEPGADKDGVIQVTTGCVFPLENITVTWFVKGCEKKDLTTVLSSNRSTCTSTCNSLDNEKVTSGFTHTQYEGSGSVEVKYKAVVTHTAYTDPVDIFTWTSAKYHIEATTVCTTTTPSTTAVTTSTTTKTTVTTKTTSTTTNMPAMPSMTNTHSTTKTSASQSTAQNLTSDDGLSKEIIIVIIFVPTVLTIMGIIIISFICYFKQNTKRLPSHQHHKKGRYKKGNKKLVSEDWQETYPSYWKHYTGLTEQSNHKENNKSKSSHYSQVKRNPLYRVSMERDPYVYHTGASSRHETYRLSYTKEHVYPTANGYHYGPVYHWNQGRQENTYYVSYPGSGQKKFGKLQQYGNPQQYGNLSFSYMEY